MSKTTRKLLITISKVAERYKDRLYFFDQATERQRAREREMQVTPAASQKRDWTREDLYERGSAG